jgi:hypothetical protein
MGNGIKGEDMMKRGIIFIFSLIIITLFFFSAEAADTEPIGVVIELNGEVTAENGANKIALALKDALTESDTIITGAGGRVKILLRDDSVITLGADSTLELLVFSDIGESPEFKASFLKGTMRIITGKITEMNPEGFLISTPHSTVGIRGTILNLRTDERRTTLYVLNTDKTVIFNGTSIAENYKAVAEIGMPLQIIPLPRQEKEDIIRELVLPPGRLNNSGIGAESDLIASAVQYNETPTDSADNNPAVNPSVTPPITLPLIPSTPTPPPPPGVTTATFQGTIPSAVNGILSFDVGLLSGDITNAATSGTYGDFTWDLTGGKGEFCPDDKFEIIGFGGTAENAVNSAQTLNSSQTWITGSAPSFDSGTSVSDGVFQLSVDDPADSKPSVRITLPIIGASQ